jgi:hypothetical protein
MSAAVRPLAALAMVAMVAVISAGCGGTRSNGGTGGKTGTGRNENATARDKAVKFTECMRGNGVPHFPDPKASGEFPSFGIDVSGPVWNRAVGACKALQPPGSLSARMNPRQMSAALRFAECMRQNGVKDFPDPVNGQPLIDTYKIPSSNTPAGMSILNAAAHKCRTFVAAAMAGR